MRNKKVKLKNTLWVAVLLAVVVTVPSFAASTNWIDRVPAVMVDQEITGNLAPRLAIEEYAIGEFSDAPQHIRLILTGAEWLGEDHAYGPEQIELDTLMSGDAEYIQVQRLSATMLEVTLTASGASTEKGVWRIPLYSKALEAGNISVKIDAMDSMVTGSINTFADGVSGDTEVPEEPDVPAAPEKPEQPETPGTLAVTFTIGQSGYWVNGQWIASDVAPYIQPTTEGLGRIMVPVRFVSEATGADDVIWDPVGRNVIVLKGGTQIQMTIGSRQLLVNGDIIEMDAVAEIQEIGVGLGRTMIPVAHMARALGVDYTWDPITRSVTFTVKETHAPEDTEDNQVAEQGALTGE